MARPRSRSILIVEGDPRVAQGWASTLENAGYLVQVAHDARTALDLSESQPFSVVVVDVLIMASGEMNLASAWRDRRDFAVLAVGAADHAIPEIWSGPLAKPLASDELLARLRTLMGAPGSGEAVTERPEASGGALSPWPEVGTPDADGAFSGPYRPVLFAELMGTLYRRRFTGVALSRRGTVKKMVHVRQGRPVFVRSNLLSECLGQVLVSAQLIAQADCDEALELKKTNGLRIGENLLRMGCISEETLRAMLEQQLQDKLLELFTWREGQYFVVARLDEGPEIPLRLEVAELVAEGLRRIEETDVIRALQPVWERGLRVSDEPRLAVQAAAIDADGWSALKGAGPATVRTFLDVEEPDRAARARLLVALGSTGAIGLEAPLSRPPSPTGGSPGPRTTPSEPSTDPAVLGRGFALPRSTSGVGLERRPATRPAAPRSVDPDAPGPERRPATRPAALQSLDPDAPGLERLPATQPAAFSPSSGDEAPRIPPRKPRPPRGLSFGPRSFAADLTDETPSAEETVVSAPPLVASEGPSDTASSTWSHSGGKEDDQTVDLPEEDSHLLALVQSEATHRSGESEVSQVEADPQDGGENLPVGWWAEDAEGLGSGPGPRLGEATLTGVSTRPPRRLDPTREEALYERWAGHLAVLEASGPRAALGLGAGPIDGGAVDDAQKAAQARFAAELEPVAATSGRLAQLYEALLVALEDAKADLLHPDASRRDEGRAPPEAPWIEALAHFEQGLLAARGRSLDEARYHFDQARQLDPEIEDYGERVEACEGRSDSLLGRLVRARKAREDGIDAQAAWEAVLERDPDNAEALFALRPPETSGGLWSRFLKSPPSD